MRGSGICLRERTVDTIPNLFIDTSIWIVSLTFHATVVRPDSLSLSKHRVPRVGSAGNEGLDG